MDVRILLSKDVMSIMDVMHVIKQMNSKFKYDLVNMIFVNMSWIITLCMMK